MHRNNYKTIFFIDRMNYFGKIKNMMFIYTKKEVPVHLDKNLTLEKGGYLLSHIALQYHRRCRA